MTIHKYDPYKLGDWTEQEIADELNMLKRENGKLRRKASQYLGQRNAARLRLKRNQNETLEYAQEKLLSVAMDNLNKREYRYFDMLRDLHINLFKKDWSFTNI